MPEVKWVSSYQIGIHKSEDCEVPVITLDQIEAWLNEEREFAGKRNCHVFDALLAQVQAWKE